MRTSEPKPHEIDALLVSFDSEVRKRERCVASDLRFRSSQTMLRPNDANFGIGTLAATEDDGATDVTICGSRRPRAGGRRRLRRAALYDGCTRQAPSGGAAAAHAG